PGYLTVTSRGCLFFCGRLAASDLVRLSLYVRLLEQLIRTLTSEAIVKLVTAVAGHLLEHDDTVDAALAAALDALNGSIGMSASALTVTPNEDAVSHGISATSPTRSSTWWMHGCAASF